MLLAMGTNSRETNLRGVGPGGGRTCGKSAQGSRPARVGGVGMKNDWKKIFSFE
jgi:hypothetical protein